MKRKIMKTQNNLGSMVALAVALVAACVLTAQADTPPTLSQSGSYYSQNVAVTPPDAGGSAIAQQTRLSPNGLSGREFLFTSSGSENEQANIPEPTTLISAALLLLLPFGACALRIIRRKTPTS